MTPAESSTSNVVPFRLPETGRAIPFSVWDTVIPAYELTPIESGMLLYLCRETHSRGLHHGVQISLPKAATSIRTSESSAQRALNRLAQLGLIVRTRQYETGRREHAATFISVPLPFAEVGSQGLDLAAKVESHRPHRGVTQNPQVGSQRLGIKRVPRITKKERDCASCALL
jgi:hypothetical protein